MFNPLPLYITIIILWVVVCLVINKIMVRIVDGIGRPILCEDCKQELTLSSKDDYCSCTNCKNPFFRSVKDESGILPLIWFALAASLILWVLIYCYAH